MDTKKIELIRKLRHTVNKMAFLWQILGEKPFDFSAEFKAAAMAENIKVGEKYKELQIEINRG